MKNKTKLSIFRFAHAFATGAGTETYLEDLDKTLLSRNVWSIFRVFLTREQSPGPQGDEILGKGRLIRIPVCAEIADEKMVERTRDTMDQGREWLKAQIRDKIILNPFLYRVFFRGFIQKIGIPPRRQIEATGIREVFRGVLKLNKIDLLVMHHVGGRDGAELVEEAVINNIPYVFINHYSNDVFNHLSVRRQIIKAAGIGGVSNVDVPQALRKCFFNLSDGIDTEVFKPKDQGTEPLRSNLPIVLLPARVTPSKGQRDLIKACAILKRSGVRMLAAMAGRIDSTDYLNELKRLSFEKEVHKDVLFLGELSCEQLRQWYESAAVVVFPTYHNEGLGRVLIESQSMHTPVISYIIGGTPEALLDGETGYLVRKGDITQFGTRLKELLLDKRKCKQMGIAGREFIENRFSLNALAKRHEQFYSKAINI